MGKRKKKDLIEDIEFGVIHSSKGREDGQCPTPSFRNPNRARMGNTADGLFSAACEESTPRFMPKVRIAGSGHPD
jgi:hypothetical protein